MEITTSSLTITYASLLSVIIIHIAVSTDIELSSMRSLEPRDFVKMFLKYLLTIRRFKIYFSNETRFKNETQFVFDHIFFSGDSTIEMSHFSRVPASPSSRRLRMHENSEQTRTRIRVLCSQFMLQPTEFDDSSSPPTGKTFSTKIAILKRTLFDCMIINGLRT